MYQYHPSNVYQEDLQQSKNQALLKQGIMPPPSTQDLLENNIAHFDKMKSNKSL